MEQVKHPENYEICQFDGISMSTVYVGGLHELKPVVDKITWREDETTGELCYQPYKVLTLNEIRDQVKNLYGGNCPMITIFTERPLGGCILQYGNYGDSWWQVGDLAGYA